MKDLTNIDWWQIVGLIIAGVIAVVQMVFNVKDSEGKLSALGYVLVFLFTSAAVTAIVSTILKTKADKRDSVSREQRFDTITQNIRHSIKSLEALQTVSNEQNTKIEKQIIILERLTNESKEIVGKNTFLYERKVVEERERMDFFKDRLSLSVNTLNRIFDFTIFKQPLDQTDVERENQLRSSVMEAIKIVNSEYENPFIKDHPERLKIWNEYRDKILNLDWMINGYLHPTKQELFDSTFEASRFLGKCIPIMDPKSNLPIVE